MVPNAAVVIMRASSVYLLGNLMPGKATREFHYHQDVQPWEQVEMTAETKVCSRAPGQYTQQRGEVKQGPQPAEL